MEASRLSRGSLALLAILVMLPFLPAAKAVAQTETILRSFSIDTGDGDTSYAGLVMNAAGNLYGTTYYGGQPGSFGQGTVFELMPGAGGVWKQKLLHAFSSTGGGGFNPNAGLVVDAAGNLYGTTSNGGAHGVGTVFELSPQSTGKWTMKVLHHFGAAPADGANPQASMIFDGSGNLYGTAPAGGGRGAGMVFELVPTVSGLWVEKLLHTFGGSGDGSGPRGGLIFDAAGNLYGTTSLGGSRFSGTAFELLPTPDGLWKEKILYNFSDASPDGGFPQASLIFDAVGNLYGTTAGGGATGDGIVFELQTSASGTWIETNLHDFSNDGNDGFSPLTSLLFDSAGDLYGTTYGGGANDWGIVYKLTPEQGGTWTESIVHTFNHDGTDGIRPYSNLIIDTSGNLYSTTSQGGTHDGGTVFEITP